MSQFKLSMLDLVAVREGQTVSQAIATALQTAQHAERLGFSRYWLAEHHNMPGLACSSTAVLIGHIAAGTQRIRLGAGGIMLPNHAPLVVAEAFGTLQAMYPGRIDLGLGRAPGTDQLTMRALRRDRVETEEDFPREVAELQQLLGEPQPGQRVIASPGAGSHVPIWLLGSSLFSAQLAAARGLPYAFASHFAPRHLMQALSVYRSHFVPSAVLSKPRVIVGVPLIAAPTDDEAQFLATSVFQRVSGIVRGERRTLQPPVAGFLESRDPREQAAIADFLNMAVIGGPETVAEQLHKIAEITAADELMLVCDIFDPALRLRALEIAAGQSRHQT
jgi:luciferase family oxidoreductase group 1